MTEVKIGKRIKRLKEDSNTSSDVIETKVEVDQTDFDSDGLDAPVTRFGFLIVDLNEIKIDEVYHMLKRSLKVGKDRLDPDILSEAIDAAPEWAFKATQLYVIAKEKLAKFNDLIFKVKYALLATKASEELEIMRKEKKLNGQITKEKIENWIVLHVPEYKRLLREKRELETAVELLKSLATQFESKKSMLQTQGRLSERKKFVVTPNKGGDS